MEQKNEGGSQAVLAAGPTHTRSWSLTLEGSMTEGFHVQGYFANSPFRLSRFPC